MIIRTKRYFIAGFFLVTCTITGVGQNTVFSQNSQRSLIKSPCFTATQSSILGSVGRRTQWSNLSNYLESNEASVAFPFLGDGSRETNLGGIGVYIQQTSLINKQFNSLNAHLAGAYNLELGQNNVIFGLDLGIIQNTISPESFTTGNQFWISGFNPELSNEITLATNQVNALDISFGVHFNHKQNFNTRTDKFKLSTGISLNHLNSPNISFGSEKEGLPILLNAYAFIEHKITKNIFIEEHGIFYKQANSNQAQIGLFGKYVIRDKEESLLNTSLLFGSYYRLNDALIPYIRFEYKFLGFGVSYDFTTSTLSEFNNNAGGMEFQLFVLVKKEPTVKERKNHGGARFKTDY